MSFSSFIDTAMNIECGGPHRTSAPVNRVSLVESHSVFNRVCVAGVIENHFFYSADGRVRLRLEPDNGAVT